MADKPLFNLDAEGRWRLAFDAQQWIIQRRVGNLPLIGWDSLMVYQFSWILRCGISAPASTTAW